MVSAEAWPCAESLRKATSRLGWFCGRPLGVKNDEHNWDIVVPCIETLHEPHYMNHFIEMELGYGCSGVKP